MQGMFMSLSLKDPRKYSNVFPETNILISQASSDLANNDNNNLLVALIEDILKQGQDQLLSVAYNLAPNQEVADYIWHALQKAINQPNCDQYAQLFALPIVLVVGSAIEVRLPSSISKIALTDLMCKKQIFLIKPIQPVNLVPDVCISGKLYGVAGIVKLRPSYLFNQVRNLKTVSDWNDDLLSNEEIKNVGEGVYLRFLAGVAIQDKNQGSALNEANYKDLGLELMQLLISELKTDDATIYPIPFSFCALSEAAVIGEHHRKEIHMTVRLANQVKNLRKQAKIPEIKLVTKDNNIKVEIWQQGADCATEIINWPLQRTDNFLKICQILSDLFADMQLKIKL